MAGVAEDGVDAVVISVGSGRVTATVSGGHFVACWPYAAKAERIEAWDDGVLVADDPIFAGP
jgi:hypothetical protein